MFLTNDPSYKDIWLKPQWMTLAYAQVLQYWAEKANLLAPSEPRPLVMSARELRWRIGKYTTFSNHDVFEGLGSALPEAKNEDMGTPPVDSTASPAMTDVEDTQLSPTETQSADDPIPPLPKNKSEAKDEDRGTQSADDTTILLAKPRAVIEQDLQAAHSTSPTRPKDPFAPTAPSMDKLPDLSTELTVQRVKDKNTQSG